MQDDCYDILIVDDEPQVGFLLRGMLMKAGLRSRVVTDPRQAMELLSTEYIRVLITDISMPGTSGIDLLAHARACAPVCRVILITGASTREYLAQALLLGAKDYIEKPFDHAQVVQAVFTALGDFIEIPALHARAAAAMELSSQAKQVALNSVQPLARAAEAKVP